MAMSRDEQRAYQRGHNRSIARISDRVHRVVQIAKGYRARAATAELLDTSLDNAKLAELYAFGVDI